MSRWAIFDRGILSFHVHEFSSLSRAGELKRNARGQLNDVLEFLDGLVGQNKLTGSATHASLVQECGRRKSLAEGKQLHAHIIKSGFKVDPYLGKHLITMYNKCASVNDARQVFDNMLVRTVASWNAMIHGYARHGDGREAIKLYFQMQQQGVRPDKITYIGVLNACANAETSVLGKLLHAQIVDRGVESDVAVSNTLVNMYGKCGNIGDAHRTFDMMCERDVVSWNVIIAAYAQNGYGQRALEVFQRMQQDGVKPNKITFIIILKACASRQALSLGRLTHACIADQGFESDVVVGTALVSMYGKCGSLEDTQRMFIKMPERNVVSWNVMIGGYAGHGYAEEAFKLIQQMQREGMKPDTVTFISILNGCACPQTLALGKLTHAYIIGGGAKFDIVVGNTLVNMYGKCGSINDAYRMFHEMPERNLVSWNAMIGGYAGLAYNEEAFELFQEMQREGVMPDKISFISILNTCASPNVLPLGKLIHANIVEVGIEQDISLGNALVNMYGKCGSAADACVMFDKMLERNVVSWNAMIAAFAQNGYHEAAYKVFQQMQHEGLKPDKITLISLLNLFTRSESLALGKLVHSDIVNEGYESDVVVGTALVNMYAKCGRIEAAHRIFNKMTKRNVVSWTAIIGGYSRLGHAEEAVELYQQMQEEGASPDKVTFISILNTCDNPESLTLGWLVHAQIVEERVQSDVVVATALVNMYSRCSGLSDACMIFDTMSERNVVSWNAMISVYAEHGHHKEAFKLFSQMQEEGMKPDRITFINMLHACTDQDSLALGRLVHARIVDEGGESDIIVGNALVNMYGKWGSIRDACQIFNRMPERDVVSWNALIAAHVHHGSFREAFDVFLYMQQNGVRSDNVTFICILNACASPDALVLGRQVHSYIADEGFESAVGTALVNMYGRCGSIEDARMVFDRIPKVDAVSWSAMIAAYAQHGYGKDALRIFQQMKEEGMKPDRITFISVLNACSHAGLVDEGMCYFNSMIQDHGIMPTLEHYTCVVDLLGRSGQLDEAEELINTMPVRHDAVIWLTFLGSCRIHGCIDRGIHAAERALELDPHSASAYVILSNIYAITGRWRDVTKIRKLMVDRGVKKEPGCSWIEVNNNIHEFVVRDTSHPQAKEVFAELEMLSKQLGKAGYKPDQNLVLHDVEEEQKEQFLSHHSEKLAIGFGLISTPCGTPLYITKNLRVCCDCHTFTKFTSKIVGREIVVRDANRFHHFKDGVCSCGDYW